MNRWFLPIRILIATLTLLALGASFSWNGTDAALWLGSLRDFCLLFFAGWTITWSLEKLGLATRSRTEHRLITTLILFLLFDTLTPWWVFLLLGAVSELLQRLIRTPGGPLFNPAALGALTFSFFGYFPSWWGTNFSPRFLLWHEEISSALLITLPLALYVAYRYRKHWISLAAASTFSLVYFLLLHQSPLFILLDGTLLFFLLVMASEPKTSPVLLKEQLVFGMLIGILVPLGIFFHWLEAYTLALLLANLYTKRAFLHSLFFPVSPEAR